MLGAYMESPHLQAWGDRAQFVLASLAGSNPEESGSQEPVLWAVSAQSLTDFTDQQAQGTINQESLDELSSIGAAEPLEEILERWASGEQLAEAVNAPPRRQTREIYESLWFHPFNLSAPSPLGLVLPP